MKIILQMNNHGIYLTQTSRVNAATKAAKMTQRAKRLQKGNKTQFCDLTCLLIITHSPYYTINKSICDLCNKIAIRLYWCACQCFTSASYSYSVQVSWPVWPKKVDYTNSAGWENAASVQHWLGVKESERDKVSIRERRRMNNFECFDQGKILSMPCYLASCFSP